MYLSKRFYGYLANHVEENNRDKFEKINLFEKINFNAGNKMLTGKRLYQGCRYHKGQKAVF